ncbi:MAG: RNA polymerase sigma factor [Bacteroidota bacterium]
MNQNEKYLNALLEGNDQGIKEIYANIFPRVKAYILMNRGHTSDALDVFHDALMSIIIGHKENKLNIRSFDSYLLVVCKNLWKKRLKNKVIKVEADTLKEEPLKNNNQKIEQEKMDFYIEKFQLLSPNCKEILSNYFNGWTYEELMDEFNYSSINTIRQRVFKCRTKLVSLIKSDKRYQKLKEWNFS